jgi:hypothetical protein
MRHLRAVKGCIRIDNIKNEYTGMEIKIKPVNVR